MNDLDPILADRPLMTFKTNERRFAVTGGRAYPNVSHVRRNLDKVPQFYTLVHGAAPGADSIAANYWIDLGRRTNAYPADWDKFGREAGPIRNEAMAMSGLEFCIAFPGGRGTQNMINHCMAHGVPVLDLRHGQDVHVADGGFLMTRMPNVPFPLHLVEHTIPEEP